MTAPSELRKTKRVLLVDTCWQYSIEWFDAALFSLLTLDSFVVAQYTFRLLLVLCTQLVL